MQIPLELTFRDVAHRPEIEQLVREKADKLERFCDHITSCRVAIEKEHQHETGGGRYRVRIDLTIPLGHEIVVSKDHRHTGFNDNLRPIVHKAFQVAEQRLKALMELQRRDVKVHEEVPRALVARIFRDEGYGFLQTLDGRGIYFTAHALVENDFHRLEIGTEVRYVEAMGVEGPQASTVHIIAKPGARIKMLGEEESELAGPA